MNFSLFPAKFLLLFSGVLIYQKAIVQAPTKWALLFPLSTIQTEQRNLLSIVLAAAAGPTSIKNSFNVEGAKENFFLGQTLSESLFFLRGGKRQIIY